jgi:cysteine-rich repeat protein
MSTATVIKAVVVTALVACWVLPGAVPTARAVDFTGTVHFEGAIVFSAPIAGIAADDLEITVKPATEATGNGEKCSILSVGSDNPDIGGSYPDAGDVNAEILIERGGPQIPDGDCIVTLEASGTDGVSVSARGSQTVFVSANEVDTSATVIVDDIIVRESKAIAGIDRDCRKWVIRQLKKRRKCNFVLLKQGALAAGKCKDGGIEPLDCDPGDHVEAILALSHGGNDQQTDPNSAQAIDSSLLRDQLKCQGNIGKAAVNFGLKRLNLVRQRCVDAADDSVDCRDQQSKDAKRRLDKIDKCVGDQEVDGGTGLLVPDVDSPCDVCIDGGGVIDRTCLKSCIQVVVDELSDGIMGDVPVCGNGILQSPEFCDDGNTDNGDCCSSTCTVESLGDQMCGVGACEVTVPVCQAGEPAVCVPGTPGTEGPMGDATCSDTIDNDCDGDTDAADIDCQ